MSKQIITCIAGEPSGDLLGAELVSGLKSNPFTSQFQLNGIGGAHMASVGFQSNWDMSTLSVRGYVEALKQLPAILKIRKELINSIQVNPPSVYVGIDAPDFNLFVEKKCKQWKIPTVHYIGPSIWAWRSNRLNNIKKAVDHMLCIFPFEPGIYHEAGMKATYVGHPLAHKIPLKPDPDSARKFLFQNNLLQFGEISTDETIIAVLPGSRQSEIEYIGKGFFEAIGHMYQMHQGSIRFLVPVATPMLMGMLVDLKNDLLITYPNAKIELVNGQSSKILEAADSVLIASGTATLEAALWKKPMVISYTVPWLTAQIMKRQGYLPYIGLPNILCQNFVVPELLQEQADPKVMAKATLEWLDHPEQIAQLVDIFEELHHILRKPSDEIAAQVIEDTIKQSK
jgi:lipid-A-disaccharide synthase